MSPTKCPSCKARFGANVPGHDRHIQNLFGTPTLWAPTGEKYSWLACPSCGVRFMTVTDRPYAPGTNGNTYVHTVAAAYMNNAGLSPLVTTDHRRLTEREGREIAAFYEKARSCPTDANVQAAYEAFRDEVKAQHDALVQAGFKILPWDRPGQPYSCSEKMRHDVRENKQLYFFRTTEGKAAHSLLPAEDNDRFRAVHDIFGHAMGGHEFGPQGESNAFRDHYHMFTPTARLALATETLGQNAWFNYGDHNNGKPPAGRDFAEQKATILESSLYEDIVRAVVEVLGCEG